MNYSGATGATIAPAQGGAVLRSVQDNELSGNQLNALLAANSPYIKRAQALARARAADSGQGNSSLAIGAGTAAAIDAAMPLAQQQAAAYQQAASENQAGQTQYNIADGGWRASMANAATSAGATIGAAEINARTQRERLAQDAAQQLIDNDFRDTSFNEDTRRFGVTQDNTNRNYIEGVRQYDDSASRQTDQFGRTLTEQQRQSAINAGQFD